MKSPHFSQQTTQVDCKVKTTIESLDVGSEKDGLVTSVMFPTYDTENLKRLQLQIPCTGMINEFVEEGSKPGNKVIRY